MLAMVSYKVVSTLNSNTSLLPRRLKGTKHHKELFFRGYLNKFFYFPSQEFLVSVTMNKMVVHHSGSLHVSITDGGSCEFEPTLLQFAAHGVRFFASGGYLVIGFPLIHYCFMSCERPDKPVKTPEFLPDFQKMPGVVYGGPDF